MDYSGIYMKYISTVRRYSSRTVEIYREVLDEFLSFSLPDDADRADFDSSALSMAFSPQAVRNYEVYLLDKKKLGTRTVNQHLSVLSGWGKYLVKEGHLATNPVSGVKRPKMEKRLPEFYRKEDLDNYFEKTSPFASEENLSLITGSDKASVDMYRRRLRRLIVLFLYDTAIRRSELISLDLGSVDFSRRTLRVIGKGDKTREIPLVGSLCNELSLYLQARALISGEDVDPDGPLLATEKGGRLYPVYVDRAVKEELGEMASITGRKSPHVLRHTLATELLDEGADLNSIKEMLGHASLAATQVYTHNTIDKLRTVYANAHPRAKNKVKNGD